MMLRLLLLWWASRTALAAAIAAAGGDAERSGAASAEYDVIVIGGGLVGSAVASSLAEKLPGKQVLLLEAGAASHKVLGGKDPPASWDPGSRSWRVWPSSGALGGLTRYDVPGNYEVLQCWDRSCMESWGKVVPYFQCKVLGGCGVMNGALMQIPHQDNFANLPAGWQFADFKKYYDQVESVFSMTSSPSQSGLHYMEQAGGDSIVRSALEAKGFRFSTDTTPNAKTFATPMVTAKAGVRQSTASVFLPKALGLKNFEMRLESEVLKIEHGSGTATGVIYRSASGSSQRAALKANGLVVVTAGALNTPRLLLASQLDGGGSVGSGLSDHTLQSAIYTVPDGGADGSLNSLSPPPYDAIMAYAESRSGPLAQFGPTLTAFFKAPWTPGDAGAFDVETWVNPIGKRGEVHLSLVLMRPRCPEAKVTLRGDGSAGISGATNAGCKDDKDVLTWAWKEIDVIMAAKGGRRTSRSGYVAMNHFAGTCRLGSCSSPQTLRVKGTTNVAVADASVLGTVWGHPAMTLTALGLKAADVLAGSLQ